MNQIALAANRGRVSMVKEQWAAIDELRQRLPLRLDPVAGDQRAASAGRNALPEVCGRASGAPNWLSLRRGPAEVSLTPCLAILMCCDRSGACAGNEWQGLCAAPGGAAWRLRLIERGGDQEDQSGRTHSAKRSAGAVRLPVLEIRGDLWQCRLP
ncbi:hypothetical protein ACTTAI_00700 (plasmid) [Rhodobacter capsulatus]|uniref:hypothetical protein n=1 Tax=Rhodobacter capsulatus TaxID=1061 RepID=UPI004027E0CE